MEEKKMEEEKEKIPHMCESIGHRPLRGRCPKKYDKNILFAAYALQIASDHLK